MKTKIFFIGIVVFLYAFFHISAASADVIISEFSIGKYIGGKATSTSGDDFIELYNTGDKCVPLVGWRLRKRIQSGTESPLYSFKKGDAIIPNDFFLWVSSKAKPDYQKLADVIPTVSQEYTLSGNNSVALLDSKNVIQDAVTFGGEHIQPFSPSTLLLNPEDGLSFERNLSSLEWKKDTSVIPNPTGASLPVENDLDSDGCPDQIVPIPPTPKTEPAALPTPAAKTVRFSEIFPNPKAKGDAGEFIELYNFGIEPADISGWVLRDATKTGKYIFPTGTIITAAAYLAVTDQSFKLSLNNSNETVTLFDNTDVIIDSVRYAKTKDDVSLNYTATGWRGGTPTPGAANILNSLPEIREKVPKKGFKGTSVVFSATGKDADGDTLKYTWDFGDGHKSYKAETSHIYEENGTYVITLTTTDGVEDSVETFAIEIRSYKPPEVRITSLMPNPEGKDTDNEWIIIENREKKTINLKDFGIATGWKNLVNHPIREDFLIEPKKSAKLTRTFSLFTLPNQKGKIELRAPDGKVLQTIKYKLEKSAAENSVYSKTKGKRWEWQQEEQIPDNDQQETETSALPDTLETGQKDTLPKEEVFPIEEDGDSEKEVLGAKVSRSDNYDVYLRLLNTGTRVKIPDGIALAFDETADNTSDLPVREHYTVSFARESLSLFNASLNGLLRSDR